MNRKNQGASIIRGKPVLVTSNNSLETMAGDDPITVEALRCRTFELRFYVRWSNKMYFFNGDVKYLNYYLNIILYSNSFRSELLHPLVRHWKGSTETTGFHAPSRIHTSWGILTTFIQLPSSSCWGLSSPVTSRLGPLLTKTWRIFRNHLSKKEGEFSFTILSLHWTFKWIND